MEEQELIYLVSCAVNNEAPDRERIAGMDMEALYKTASRHMLAAAAAPALKAAGVRDLRFSKALEHSAMKNSIMDMETEAISAELEAAGIWYMPLKGTVLQNLYPIYGMRQMSDHDILFDASRAKDVKDIMEGLGFNTERFASSYNDVYHKKPVCNFEMHTALFGPKQGEKLYIYYKDVQERLLGDGFEKHFKPEDFYLYITAHEYKHFSVSGTGIRSLLDCYVYLKANSGSLDFDYIREQTDALGITDFEQQRRELALKVFGSGDASALSENERKMLEYYLQSGTYGTFENSVKSSIRKEYKRKGKRSKLSYIAKRVFPDLHTLTSAYPFVHNNPLLYPAGVCVRIFRALTKNHRRIKKELDILKKL